MCLFVVVVVVLFLELSFYLSFCCFNYDISCEVKVKVTQSCLTLCDPMDYIVHGTLQARILEWVAMPSSRGSSQPRERTQVSHIAEDSLPAEPPGKHYSKSLQSCPTLCNPIDGSPPGSPIPGILQARTLEWVAIFFNAWKWKVKVKLLSCVWLWATPWTAAYQAPPSMRYSRQGYWSGVPLPSPREALLGIYLCLSCLSLSVFPVPDICFLLQIQEIFSSKFIKYIKFFFSLCFSLLFGGTPLCLKLSQSFLNCSHFSNLFFFSLFWLDDFHYFIFQIAYALFSIT